MSNSQNYEKSKHKLCNFTQNTFSCIHFNCTLSFAPDLHQCSSSWCVASCCRRQGRCRRPPTPAVPPPCSRRPSTPCTGWAPSTVGTSGGRFEPAGSGWHRTSWQGTCVSVHPDDPEMRLDQRRTECNHTILVGVSSERNTAAWRRGLLYYPRYPYSIFKKTRSWNKVQNRFD